MRILMITPYVTIIGRPEFERNKTGFGYMVYDIAKAIAVHFSINHHQFTNNRSVDVFATDSRGIEFDVEGVHYLKRSIGLMLLNLFWCLKPYIICKLLKTYPLKRGAIIRLCYYWMLTGQLYRLLSKKKYDVVHIHGCSCANELWMEVCRKHNVKFLITLHGLNSFSNSVSLDEAGKKYERDFLKDVVAGQIPISVISTGIKRQIEKSFGGKECKNITVVCNSYNFNSEPSCDINIRQKYNIPQECKVLLYVGNISKNKNQMQMVDVYMSLPKAIRNSIYIFFCGNLVDFPNFGEVVSSICDNGHLIVCGAVAKKDMPEFYKQSDGVILLSISEGFGLSLIEGMHFGKPCLSFTDIDAFFDIYNTNTMVGVKDRNNEAVVEGLHKLITKEWNPETIKEYSRKFESDAMAKRYINIYKTLTC